MRPGKVATIRINPKDCMAVLDVCRSVGIELQGASFASLTSLALSSLLQTMRDHKIIPERDGFEYGEMMAPFTGGNNARKAAIADTIHRAGSRLKISGLSQPGSPVELSPHPERPMVEVVKPAPSPETPPSMELRQAQRRLGELCQKKELADQRGSGIVWSASDEREFQECYKVVYPDG